MAEKRVLLARNSYEHLRATLRNFYGFTGGIEPAEITKPVVLAWLADLQGRNGGTTVNTRYGDLRAYVNWLVNERFIKKSPLTTLQPPKRPRLALPVFREHHVRAMMEQCPPNTWWGARDGAIIQTLLRTGLRRAELTGMRVQDVDFDARSILVTGKGDKQRRVWVDGVTVTWLMRYQRQKKGLGNYFWETKDGQPLAADPVRQMLHDLGVRAGIKDVRVSPHTFRHTFAVNYLRVGGDIRHLQEIMGHTSLKPLEIYLRMINAEDAMMQHERLNPFKGWG